MKAFLVVLGFLTLLFLLELRLYFVLFGSVKALSTSSRGTVLVELLMFGRPRAFAA